MLNIRIFFAVCILISANAGAQTVVDNSAKSIDQEILNSLLKTVTDSFRDPGSSQLRNIRLGSLPNGYCGEVNAKNGFGAYVGFVPFLFQPERRIQAPDDDSGSGRMEPPSARVLDPSEDLRTSMKPFLLEMFNCIDSQGRFIRK